MPILANCRTGFIWSEFQTERSGVGRVWARATEAVKNRVEMLATSERKSFFIFNDLIFKHIVAKEIYKLGLNIRSSKEKQTKKEMISNAFDMFNDASSKSSFQSFYYLGEMAQNGDMPGGVDLKYAYNCFCLAASKDSPEAYFKLAKLYLYL